MADLLLRLSEREDLGGDPLVGARVIAQRLRLGLLPRERVVLAALLGGEGARLVMFAHDPDQVVPSLLDALSACGPTVCIRAAAIATRLVEPTHPPARAALDAVEAWLREPTAEGVEEARRCAQAAWALAWRRGEAADLGPCYASSLTARAVWDTTAPLRAAGVATGSAVLALRALLGDRVDPQSGAAVQPTFSADALRDALRDPLMHWVLAPVRS